MEQAIDMLHDQLKDIRGDLKEMQKDIVILKERKALLHLPTTMKEWTTLIMLLGALGLIPAGVVETATHYLPTSSANASEHIISIDE